jgi:hypothetical protein
MPKPITGRGKGWREHLVFAAGLLLLAGVIASLCYLQAGLQPGLLE